MSRLTTTCGRRLKGSTQWVTSPAVTCLPMQRISKANIWAIKSLITVRSPSTTARCRTQSSPHLRSRVLVPPEEELKKGGQPYLAASVPFMSTTKGRAVKEEHGLCKLLVAPDHRILGCHIVGYQASVLLQAVLPIMKWRNDIHSLVDLIYIHPSLAEVVRGAARKAAGMLPTSCRDMEVADLHC